MQIIFPKNPVDNSRGLIAIAPNAPSNPIENCVIASMSWPGSFRDWALSESAFSNGGRKSIGAVSNLTYYKRE